MRQCLRCRGLVPEAVSACPNCEVTHRRLGVKGVLAAASLLSLASNACVMSALYGLPCTSKQIDGGNNGCLSACDTVQEDGGDPAANPESECFASPDGGAGDGGTR